MKALLYVTWNEWKNRIRKALKKPVTYLFLLFGIGYLGFVCFVIGRWIMESDFGSVKGLVAVLTVLTYFEFFSNFAIYAKRKGIIFKQSHAHFIFTAPIDPKSILLYAAMKNYALSFVMSVIGMFGASVVFDVSLPKAGMLFLFMFVFQLIFDGSLVIFLYGNERLPEKAIRRIGRGIWMFLGGIALAGFFYFRVYGFHIESAAALVDFPAVQMVPIVGWNVAAYRLILYGPTTLNVIGTALYLLGVLAMAIGALRMKCTGGYFEDAAKYADDYVEAKRKSKSGEAVLFVGQKKKFKGKVTVRYNGTGAKAIFFRQLLEYKKEKWFIFSFMTILCAGAAVFMIQVWGPSDKPVQNLLKLLGVLAYVALVSSGYMGKWEKELKSPYLYLIPDTPLRKMWYATLMEHIKSLIDGMIMAIPVGFAWNMPIHQIVLAILVYVVFQANRLYMKIFVETVLGDTFGNFLKKTLRTMSQMSLLGIGFVLALVVGIFVSVEWIFPIILLYSVLMTILVALLAASRFDKMEQME